MLSMTNKRKQTKFDFCHEFEFTSIEIFSLEPW